MLQHVADPVGALREMARVTRPGGVVAVRDSDYAAFAWYPRLPGLDRWLALYQDAARANGGEPDAGRHLLAWAHAAGLTEVRRPRAPGASRLPRPGQWWGGMWAERITGSALADQLLREGRGDRGRARRRSPAPGASGPPTPTAGSRCRTASCWPASADQLREVSSRASRDRMSSSAARIGAESPL